MKYPARVKIIDVGPRDGLQNEQRIAPTEAKLDLVDRLIDASARARFLAGLAASSNDPAMIAKLEPR